MWVSLICTKSRLPARCAASAPVASIDEATPPEMLQSTPAPAQLMHFITSRRPGSAGAVSSRLVIRAPCQGLVRADQDERQRWFIPDVHRISWVGPAKPQPATRTGVGGGIDRHGDPSDRQGASTWPPQGPLE